MTRPRTWLWVSLAVVAVLLIGLGGGGFALYSKIRHKADTTVAPTHAIGRASGPAGEPMAGPTRVSSPSGVRCEYLPADRGGGEPRLVDPPTPVTTLAGRVNVTIKTNLGDISVDLLADRAPCAVHSFVHLAQQDYYASTGCHRLTTDGLYVLQCGDPSGTGTGTPGYQYREENLPTSATPQYPRATVAIANAGPGTNGAQFFIVYRDSDIPPDYTIFGMVVAGLDIVERVAAQGVENDSTDGRPKLELEVEEVTVT
jgi:peptidyl-prolyl cis-trans isomerase B (cyclophilin B)